MPFWCREHLIFAILCHCNKINQLLWTETHPGDSSVRGTGPGFPRSIRGADGQRGARIPALRCSQGSAQDHHESSWIKSLLPRQQWKGFWKGMKTTQSSPLQLGASTKSVCFAGLGTIWFEISEITSLCLEKSSSCTERWFFVLRA